MKCLPAIIAMNLISNSGVATTAKPELFEVDLKTTMGIEIRELSTKTRLSPNQWMQISKDTREHAIVSDAIEASIKDPTRFEIILACYHDQTTSDNKGALQIEFLIIDSDLPESVKSSASMKILPGKSGTFESITSDHSEVEKSVKITVKHIIQ